jgi:hypothetical protein
MPGTTLRRIGDVPLLRRFVLILLTALAVAACGGDDTTEPLPGQELRSPSEVARVTGEPGEAGRVPGEPTAGQQPAVLHNIGALDVLPESTAAWPIVTGVIPPGLATISTLGCVVGADDCPEARLPLLADGGVDVVNVATSPVASTEADTVAAAVETLGESGVAIAGYGQTMAEAVEPVIVRSGGISVAIHAISLVERSEEQPADATAESAGIAGPAAFTDLLLSMQESEADGRQVLVLVDWGDPDRRSPNEEMVAMAESLIRSGADAVVGNGSDFLNRLEVIDGVPVVFDLGHGATASELPLRRDTAILRLVFGSATEAPCLLPATADADGPVVDDETEVRCTTG